MVAMPFTSALNLVAVHQPRGLEGSLLSKEENTHILGAASGSLKKPAACDDGA